MNTSTDPKDTDTKTEVKEVKEQKRIETNKTDPQLTELKGFVDPDEPLEEKGTINPLTD